MSQEIERKFRIRNFDQLCQIYYQNHEVRNSIIKQGYLAIEPSGTEVRLRREGFKPKPRHYLTVKNGQGLIRGETETEISQLQFQVLWPMTEGRRIEKVRHHILVLSDILSDILKLEIDCYTGNLEGLYIAEIEFPTEAEAKKFQPLVWLGDEVTTDKRFKNQNLATLKDISALKP